MVEEKVQRVYTVPLGKAYEYTRTKRARRTVSLLRDFLARHMKVELGAVRISEALNMHIWGRSMQKPPRKVKINVVKENGMVKASLPDEKPKVKKEKKAKKAVEAKPAAKTEKSEPKKEEKPKEKTAQKKPAGEEKK